MYSTGFKANSENICEQICYYFMMKLKKIYSSSATLSIIKKPPTIVSNYLFEKKLAGWDI